MRKSFPRSALAVLALLVMLVQGTWVLAGTTGGLSGTVTDATTGKALVGVKVTVTSPSQNATATTDQTGKYTFVSLAPDTFTLIVSAPGYQPVQQAGITVQADQTLTYSVSASRTITEIGRTRSRSATDLVKPGQTADVYSINSALTQNAQGLGGGGSMFQTYAALASVPGVYVPQGSVFGQNTSGPYIRGGNYDQVGYEYDGIPVNRAFDNYVSNTQGITGQQELQIYTGGVSASSAGQGLSGYINQTIKTGTYPATANVEGVIGAQTFYHYLRGEYGGAAPNRNFSYYVGSTGWSQSYRAADNFDGGLMGPNDLTLLGFTNGNLNAAGGFNTRGGITLAPYKSGGVPNLTTRESVANLHFGIPHRNGDGKDDIQLLGSVGRQFFHTYDSLNDYGGAGSDPNLNYAGGGPYPYPTAIVYNGPIFTGFNAANLSRYYYPGMPKGCAPVDATGTCNIDPNLRGIEDNNNGIFKFQYQKNIGSSAYVRLYGYTNYSMWNIYDPPYLAANYEPFSVVGSREYQLSTHTRGVSLDFADQINSKNLITGSASYTTATVTRANNRTMQPQGFAQFRVQLRDANGNCYSPASGTLTNCYTSATSLGGGFTAASLPAAMPAIVGAAATNGAQFQVVTSGYQVTLNQVTPKFGNFSLSDQFQPSDRLKLDFGFRYNSYVYGLSDSSQQAVVGGPNALLFQNYNQEHCYDLTTRRITRALAPSFTCPAGTAHTDLSNSYPGNVTGPVFEPRFSGTYTVNPYNVVRFSAGKYSQPINSAYVQYNYAGDLAVYTANNFFLYGFNTPRHDARPQLSYNYDLSFETRLKNAPVSGSITPFYRRTSDQQQQFYLDPITNFVSGVNVGTLRAFGFEALGRYGDFNRDGWSGQISFAYTNSKIRYKNVSGTNLNIIDNINASLGRFNGLTQSGGGSPCYAGTTGTGLVGGACPAGSLANPYYGSAPVPAFDRNGWYSPYTVTPAAALGAFAVGSSASYEVPYVTTAIVQYRKNGLRIVPTFQYDSGARYGNPFTWIGYDPSSGVCPANDTSQCVYNNATVFRPNPYTGRYDSLGQFKSPGQLTVSMQVSKEFSKRVTASAILSNLYRHCFTRGYAWEQGGSQVCNYFTQSPVGTFAGGTYLGNASSPAGAFRVQNDPFGYSPANTGIPFNAFFSLQVKM